MDEYISSAEAAEALGYAQEHVARLCREGAFPGAKKIARNWLIPRSELGGYVPGPRGFAARPSRTLDGSASRGGIPMP